MDMNAELLNVLMEMRNELRAANREREDLKKELERTNLLLNAFAEVMVEEFQKVQDVLVTQ